MNHIFNRQCILCSMLFILANCGGAATISDPGESLNQPPPTDDDSSNEYDSGDASSDNGANTNAPTTGNESCTDVVACLNSNQCAPNDTACFQGCVDRGTAVAQEQFNAMDSCHQNQCATECAAMQSQEDAQACFDCRTQKCEAEATACGRTLSCLGISGCIAESACGSEDLLCFEKCLSRGSSFGFYGFISLQMCFDAAVRGTCQSSCSDASSSACNSCYIGACPTEMQTCGV